MQEISKYLLENFDIKKLKNICNSHNCLEKPTKKIKFYFYSASKGKEVFSEVYLCDAHKGQIKKAVEDIKKMNPSTIVGTDIEDLNQ